MQSVTTGIKSRGKPSRRAAWLLTAAFAVGMTGCDSLLDVENPNNVVQQDLENPEAVTALVNGALALTSSTLANVAVATADMSDEVTFTGSQNWAAELDRGIFDTPSGRSDDITNWLAQAAWTAEEALSLAAEVGATDLDIMRANLYSGMVHMTIADIMEDFAFSDRTEVGPPVGEANMQGVYDTAIERLEAAEALASGNNLVRVQAMLARAHWGRAMWSHMQGAIPADPNQVDPTDYLIDDASANQYAADVIAEIGATEDWAFELGFASASGSNPQGAWINERQEFVPSDVYVVIDGSGKAVRRDSADVDGDGITTNERDIALLDPIDNIPDQGVQQIITEFVELFLYPPLRVVTARELHLMLAESALANNDLPAFETHINHVRALKSQESPLDHTPWSIAQAGLGNHPEAIDMLYHERMANLYNMPTLRLWDMYRFGVHADQWGEASSAVLNPGQVLVIGQSERVSNCYILGTC